MQLLLKYGHRGSAALDVAPDASVIQCGNPCGQPLDDPAAAVAAALLEPLDFPPLSQAIVPGDCVAIALDRDVPQAHALIAGVVQTLCDAGTAPSAITIVRTGADALADIPDPRSSLPPDIRDVVQLATHDPTNRDDLGYLAASKEGKPIYVNRILHDADVVVPISCLRLDSALGYHGIFGGLFPTFSDEQTIERYRAPTSEDSPVQRKRRRQEADEAGWLLGVAFSIQIVPGAGDSVLHVLAGAVESVYRRGRELCDRAWRCDVPHAASLVVACIEGNRNCQNWQNVARAISAALCAVEDGGAIALCTELDAEPGSALKYVAQAEDYDIAVHEVRRHRTEDALAAVQLLRARDRNQVYLLSDLDDDVVENLGLAPISDVAEVARLCQHHKSCIVLSNAQFAVPRVESVE